MSDETTIEMVDMGTWRRDHVVQMRNAMEDAAALKLADGFPEKAGRIIGIVAAIDHLILGKDVI